MTASFVWVAMGNSQTSRRRVLWIHRSHLDVRSRRECLPAILATSDIRQGARMCDHTVHSLWSTTLSARAWCALRERAATPPATATSTLTL